MSDKSTEITHRAVGCIIHKLTRSQVPQSELLGASCVPQLWSNKNNSVNEEIFA